MDQTHAPEPAPDVMELTFDLSKIGLDELLDVVEMADADPKTLTKGQAFGMMRTMRKCLVGSSRPLTGADLQAVVSQFVLYCLSGGIEGKN